jgi:hypothetical protein
MTPEDERIERLATWIQNVDFSPAEIIRGKTVSIISFEKSRKMAKELIESGILKDSKK